MLDDVPAPGIHPRLWFGPRDLPAIRESLTHPDCVGLWLRLLAGCEGMLASEPRPLFQRHVRAAHLAFAHLVTGRPEFAEKAIAMAMNTARSAPWVKIKPGEPREGVSLPTGAAVAELISVYDWLHDRLSDAARGLFRDVIVRHGFDANRYDFEIKRPASSWHNCNGMNVINGPLVAAAILFESEIDTSDALALARSQLEASIDSFCPDGGYHEGPLYWNYATRHMLLGVEALRRHKGADLYNEPFLRHTADYILHHIDPTIERCANTADSFDDTHTFPAIARLASAHRRPHWQWLARQIIKHPWPGDDGETLEYSLFYLLWYDPNLPDAPPTQRQRTRLFHGLQALASRSDWTRDAVRLLWLNGPSNCSHNHLHLNSFTLSAFGEPLLVEMGKFDYSKPDDPRKKTHGHNTLLVDGEGQVITTDDSYWCRRLRAGEWGTVFGEFRCMRHEADSPIATGSVVNAYPDKLRTFDRTIAFVEHRFVFLHDFIELRQARPAALTWLFHAHERLSLAENGETTALFESNRARMRLKTYTTIPLRWEIHTDQRRLKCQRDHDPYVTITGSYGAESLDFFAILLPFDTEREPMISLQQTGPNEVEFGVDEKAWVYEIRTRSLRRRGDAPLPRRIV